MKRSINRVSALLETIDLEFDRVLHDKEEYIETLQHNADENISNFLTLPINVDTIEQYSKYKYPNLSTSKYWQNALLHDLNKNKYKTLKDLDIAINSAKEIINIHAKENSPLYRYSTDYITKSLAVVDPEFKRTHGFSNTTLKELAALIMESKIESGVTVSDKSFYTKCE